MKRAPLYRLLQIADSAFPRGGFAHSMGLETYVAGERVFGAASLREFVAGVLLHGAAPLEGVFLREAFRAAAGGDLERVREVDRALSAAKPVASLREASRGVGRQFLRTVAGYAPEEFLCAHAAQVRGGEAPGHYAPAFGVAARALDIPLAPALEAYLYGVAAGFVSAAVRLIPLGQSDGQRTLAALEETVRRAVGEALRRPFEDACSTVPGQEIAAMAHRRLHTRLFVS